jgi:hypothetical protein
MMIQKKTVLVHKTRSWYVLFGTVFNKAVNHYNRIKLVTYEWRGVEHRCSDNDRENPKYMDRTVVDTTCLLHWERVASEVATGKAKAVSVWHEVSAASNWSALDRMCTRRSSVAYVYGYCASGITYQPQPQNHTAVTLTWNGQGLRGFQGQQLTASDMTLPSWCICDAWYKDTQYQNPTWDLHINGKISRHMVQVTKLGCWCIIGTSHTQPPWDLCMLWEHDPEPCCTF